MDIKPIVEMNEKGFAEMYKEKVAEAFTHDWYFRGWEKIMILVCFFWTCWSLGSWLWGLF